MDQAAAGKNDAGQARKGASSDVHCPPFFFPSYHIPPEPPSPVAVPFEGVLANLISARESQCASLVRFPVKLPASLEADVKACAGDLGGADATGPRQMLNPDEETLLFTIARKSQLANK